MFPGLPFISLIIPAYNEEKRIGDTLSKYLSFFEEKYPDRHELLVVLNGCRDNTEQVVKSYTGRFPSLKYINFPEAIGKGGAIKEGFLAAKGDLVGYTDADGATRAEIMHRLFVVLELTPTLDSVIGSRRIPGSVVQGKNAKREIFSWGFNLGVNLLFGLGVKDTQCGAKVIRKEMIDKILPSFTISNMAFDVNILVDMKKQHAKVLEIPIEWEDQAGSTVKLKTPLIMGLSIFRLWLIYSPVRFLYPLVRPFGIFIWYNLLEPEKRHGLSNKEEDQVLKQI